MSDQWQPAIIIKAHPVSNPIWEKLVGHHVYIQKADLPRRSRTLRRAIGCSPDADFFIVHQQDTKRLCGDGVRTWVCEHEILTD
jgi:hypothetical protein